MVKFLKGRSQKVNLLGVVLPPVGVHLEEAAILRRLHVEGLHLDKVEKDIKPMIYHLCEIILHTKKKFA